MATADDHTYERITLERRRGDWVATDTVREISSGPMDTRAGALDDLDENVALETGDLELSAETRAAVDATAGEYERGETTPLSELQDSA